MTESDRNRDSDRIPVTGRVSGEVSVDEPMAILDLSERGARVETPFALHLGSLHDFRLSLGELSVVVKGRIAHSHIGELGEGAIRYRSGIEFVDPSDHVTAALRSFVSSQRVAAAAPPPIINAEIADDF